LKEFKPLAGRFLIHRANALKRCAFRGLCAVEVEEKALYCTVAYRLNVCDDFCYFTFRKANGTFAKGLYFI